MTRSQLEHLISASGTIADDDDIIVIGSQSILGQFPCAPAELLVPRNADVYPRRHPERAELIEWYGRVFDPTDFSPKKVKFDNPKKRFRIAFC